MENKVSLREPEGEILKGTKAFEKLQIGYGNGEKLYGPTHIKSLGNVAQKESEQRILWEPDAHSYMKRTTSSKIHFNLVGKKFDLNQEIIVVMFYVDKETTWHNKPLIVLHSGIIFQMHTVKIT